MDSTLAHMVSSKMRHLKAAVQLGISPQTEAGSLRGSVPPPKVPAPEEDMMELTKRFFGGMSGKA